MSKPNKKADLSINIIIVAAIALVVLVVLIMIFTGRINLFGTGVKSTTDSACLCADPQANRICTAGEGKDVPPSSVKCNAWNDCVAPLKCVDKG